MQTYTEPGRRSRRPGFRNMKDIALKLLCLIAELMYSASGYAQPTAPLTIEPHGWARSGYAYEVLTYETVNRGEGERKDSWKRDPRQSAEWSADKHDYAGTNYDRFHLAPCEDFADQRWKDATFVFSNCAPGNKELNRGQWKALENQIRVAADKGTTLYIFTAPLYLFGEPIKIIGEHNVPVPTHFAKAVLQVRADKPSMSAWIVANIEPAEDATFEDWKCTVNSVEFAAGVDLYGWLPDDIEEKLERQN